MPTSAAISDWVSPEKNRRCMILRSRGSSARKPGCSRGSVLARLVAGLEVADRAERVELGILVAARRGGQRQGGVGLTDLQRLDDVFLVDLGGLCELGHRGRPTELPRELLHEPRELQGELLEPAWPWTDQPLSRKCRLISPMIVGIA